MATAHDRAISNVGLPVAVIPIYGCTAYPQRPSSEDHVTDQVSRFAQAIPTTGIQPIAAVRACLLTSVEVLHDQLPPPNLRWIFL